MKWLFTLALLCLWTTGAEATSLTLSDVPAEMDAKQAFEVRVDFVTSVKNTTYYLAGVFFQTSGSNKFGFTQVETDAFVPLSDSPGSFFPITTSAEGSWSGKIKVKPDINDAGFDGEGMYFLRIDRFTGKSDNAAESSNQVEIKLLYTPPATPAPSPSPSPPPTPTPKPTPPPTPKATAGEASPSPKATAGTSAPLPRSMIDTDIKIASLPAIMGIIDASPSSQSSLTQDFLPEANQPLSNKKAPALILIGSLLATGGIIPLSMKLFPR